MRKISWPNWSPVNLQVEEFYDAQKSRLTNVETLNVWSEKKRFSNPPAVASNYFRSDDRFGYLGFNFSMECCLIWVLTRPTFSQLWSIKIHQKNFIKLPDLLRKLWKVRSGSDSFEYRLFNSFMPSVLYFFAWLTRTDRQTDRINTHTDRLTDTPRPTLLPL